MQKNYDDIILYGARQMISTKNWSVCSRSRPKHHSGALLSLNAAVGTILYAATLVPKNNNNDNIIGY